LEHWNLLPSDYKGKIHFVKAIMDEYGASREECAFVGDAKNDVQVAQEVGYAVAFNAQPELCQICSYVINQKPGFENFEEVEAYFETL
jgi:phosphoserine phosphatase